MAILNEYSVIGPDTSLLAIGLWFLMCGISGIFIVGMVKSKKAMILAAMIMVLGIGAAPFCFMEYTNPNTYGPTGKTRIEATFARGDIPVYYLNKYKVIDKVNGNVYILEEK